MRTLQPQLHPSSPQSKFRTPASKGCSTQVLVSERGTTRCLPETIRKRLQLYYLYITHICFRRSFEFGNPDTATFHFGVLLDPLSETSQKWSALLQWLATIPTVYAEVYLNPARHTEVFLSFFSSIKFSLTREQVPLKRFYRYNLPSSLSFDDNGYVTVISDKQERS